MKTLSAMLVVLILAGCSGMTTSGGASQRGAASGTQWEMQDDPTRHNNPSDIYFGS